MLHEPERTLVIRWFDAGNIPLRVPSGVSGLSGSDFRKCCTGFGLRGGVARHGLRLVADQARPFVEDGRLWIHHARAPFVFDAVAALGAPGVRDVQAATGLRRTPTLAALAVLIKTHSVAVEGACGLANRYRTAGPRPDWRAFVVECRRVA